MKVIVDTDKLPCRKNENCLKCLFYDPEVVCNIPNTLETLFPKQKTGYWRKNRWCSKCNYDKHDHNYIRVPNNFCPNCGSDNRTKENKNEKV